MKSQLCAVILSAALVISVTAGPALPEGRAGLTQEIMIDRSLAQNLTGAPGVVQVGDDRFLYLHVLPKARCVEENYGNARGLPQRCATTFRTENRLRDVYNEYCLREAGYTVSGW